MDPGSADLTADVDFSYIRARTEDKLLTFGPVTQRNFLKQMGIDMRLQVSGTYQGKPCNQLHGTGSCFTSWSLFSWPKQSQSIEPKGS